MIANPATSLTNPTTIATTFSPVPPTFLPVPLTFSPIAITFSPIALVIQPATSNGFLVIVLTTVSIVSTFLLRNMSILSMLRTTGSSIRVVTQAAAQTVAPLRTTIAVDRALIT